MSTKDGCFMERMLSYTSRTVFLKALYNRLDTKKSTYVLPVASCYAFCYSCL